MSRIHGCEEKLRGQEQEGTLALMPRLQVIFDLVPRLFAKALLRATCSLNYFRIRKYSEPRIAGGNDTCFWLQRGPV